MLPSIIDQVIDFHDALFDRIFSEPFRSQIAEPLKRRAVIRQVQDSADASSQSLTRFFLNQQLTEREVTDLLRGFAGLGTLLELNDIANPNVTPEAVVEKLLADLPCPETVHRVGHGAVYRIALHSVVQVLMLVGPVMADWQKLKFSGTYELLRRVVNRLNQISEQLDAVGHSGQAAADERYELSYRDYLLQRFHRVEAGTVRMTTNLAVDLRELFVMPHVMAQALSKESNTAESTDPAGLMDLATARKFFGDHAEFGELTEPTEKEDEGVPALDQVKRFFRNVIVGAPGSGKSTFLEWLQLKLASVEEELVMADQQAIPLLLRVRELDPQNLPRGAALIEKATASKDRATLMPSGWIDRQAKAGRVLFILDGLDETEPELRDRYILPWLFELCNEYGDCRYLVSSRPVGYSPGMLRRLEFVECDLLDFREPQIQEYTRHWCTAIRLARNEPEDEARREGTADGDQIVDGFKNHPYICNLARNPLMLSAICLVNYFEGGQLPEDRALLYQLCVEGLLHHWDQRRGIHSEFTLDEKLRTCREVALAMQADDRAEYEGEKVQEIFTAVLGEPARAEKLLEHIRYRTGLLLERRPGIFAFAHLTFQEYLAGRAVHEGNRLGVGVERLAHEHDDGRWKEVIALYCGLVPVPAAREMIERLIVEPDTLSLCGVLAESYMSAGPELSQDRAFRWRVLKRVLIAPADHSVRLEADRFPPDEVAPIANQCLGRIESDLSVSAAHNWLCMHLDWLDVTTLTARLEAWREMSTFQLAEIIHVLHLRCPDEVLSELAAAPDIYEAPGPGFSSHSRAAYGSQAEIALIGLENRQMEVSEGLAGFETALLRILCTLVDKKNISQFTFFSIDGLIKTLLKMKWLPQDVAARLELVSLTRRLVQLVPKKGKIGPMLTPRKVTALLNSWVAWLEGKGSSKSKSESKSRAPVKRISKNSPKRR